jgi:hypothetical protein
LTGPARGYAFSALPFSRGYPAGERLRQKDLFWKVVQAALEVAAPKSRVRTLLEAVVVWG